MNKLYLTLFYLTLLNKVSWNNIVCFYHFIIIWKQFCPFPDIKKVYFNVVLYLMDENNFDRQLFYVLTQIH